MHSKGDKVDTSRRMEKNLENMGEVGNIEQLKNFLMNGLEIEEVGKVVRSENSKNVVMDGVKSAIFGKVVKCRFPT